MTFWEAPRSTHAEQKEESLDGTPQSKSGGLTAGLGEFCTRGGGQPGAPGSSTTQTVTFFIRQGNGQSHVTGSH